MTRGLDLLIVFIGLETLSLVLLRARGASSAASQASSEAGLKYFLTGAFGSAFTLYGIALLFGASGGTKIDGLARPGLAGQPGRRRSACCSCSSGSASRCRSRPSTPGRRTCTRACRRPPSPTSRSRPRARACSSSTASSPRSSRRACRTASGPAIAALAILSMTLGNVVALAQRDVKRLLAYSGIAHMGYVTIALASSASDALAAAIVYFFAYLVSERRRLRRGLGALPRRDEAPPRRACSPATGGARPFAAGGPRALPLLARRHPGDGRLHREVLPLQGRAREGPLRPRPDRRRQQPRLRSATT